MSDERNDRPTSEDTIPEQTETGHADAGHADAGPAETHQPAETEQNEAVNAGTQPADAQHDQTDDSVIGDAVAEPTSSGSGLGDDGPPPLVPPPVFSSRADDTTAGPSTPSEPSAAEEPAVDRSAADARDLGMTSTPTASEEDAPGRTDGDVEPSEYAAVADPAPDAVEDHTVIRDSGDLEPDADPDRYPAHDDARQESVAETRAYDPLPVVAGSAVAGSAVTGSAGAGNTLTGATQPAPGYTAGQAFPPAPAQPRAFTPPPVEPKKKGNRGVGALIAVLSVVVFAVIYAVLAALIIGTRNPEGLGETFVQFAGNPVFYVPTIIFVIAFVLVVLLANRAGWWAYVLGSLLVGALVYFGTIGVALLTSNLVEATPQQALERLADYAVDPFIVTAALVAREVSLWTGAAVASRGRRVKAKNLSAREEYERLAAEHRAEYERGFAPAA